MSESELFKLGGKLLELLTICDCFFKRGGLLCEDALAYIASVAPDLMFKIGADLVGLPTCGADSEFGFEAAFFHGIQAGHLFENMNALGEKIKIHEMNMSSS